MDPGSGVAGVTEVLRADLRLLRAARPSSERGLERTEFGNLVVYASYDGPLAGAISRLTWSGALTAAGCVAPHGVG
jgi:hypothetical protein